MMSKRKVMVLAGLAKSVPCPFPLPMPTASAAGQ